MSGETTTYRGRSLEEVLPRIREDLGPDAVIERQRRGLVGGVGGFFQREMVEVEARAAGRPSIDVLAGEESIVPRPASGPEVEPGPDLAPPVPPADAPQTEAADDVEAGREGAEAPGLRQILQEAQPFAELLARVEERSEEPAAGPEEEPAPAPPLSAARPAAPRPTAADGHERALVAAGLSPALAAAIVAETVTHHMPFAPANQLKRLVRATLARRIPVQAGFGGAGRVIALVGPAGAGRTRCAAGLAAAYATGSDLPAVCVGLHAADGSRELAALAEPHGVLVHAAADGAAVRAQADARAGAAMVVVDTPAVSPRDPVAIDRLASELTAAGVTEVHLVLPATVAAPVARAWLGAYRALRPGALVVTHADETDHLGPLIDLAVTEDRPLSFVAEGPAVPGDLAPADPAALAARLLP